MENFLAPLGSLFVFTLLAFGFSLAKKRKDLADTFWGIGFLIVTWTSFLLNEVSCNSMIVSLLVSAWAIRLSVHIYRRNRGRREDFRYEQWKTPTQIFFQVFLLQGVILYIVALPILWIQTHPATEISFIPIVIWTIGFLIEGVSDYQLAQFKKNGANGKQLLMKGLWGYVRHPNYLGEIVQWWGIWLICAALPGGFFFIISPILITFLIIFVSGVKPLEDRMKNHPDFKKYSEKTPSLAPLSLINGTVYTIAWYVIVSFGAKNSTVIPLLGAGLFYLSQLFLFSKYDRRSFLIAIPLSGIALFLGLIQESIFIQTKTVIYLNQVYFPPLWLLTLYPVFSLTLNSSMLFLNKNLFISFLFGGLGACLSYLAGEKLGGVIVPSLGSYVTIFFSWGILLSLLLQFNRKMVVIEEFYTNRERLKESVTVFFDSACPVCAKEMRSLKKRNQTGRLEYASLTSQRELEKITTAFTFEEAMKSIHGLTHRGKILKGIDTLSEVYARTDLPLLAIFLQAPLFSPLFRMAYWVWAKIRFIF